MKNTEKYIELIKNSNISDKDTANEIKDLILEENSSLSNRELHYGIEGMLKQLDERKHLQFLITLNFPKRSANRTFNLIFKNLFEISRDNKSLIFLFKECVAQVPQQIQFYKRKQQKSHINDILEEINTLIEFAYKLYLNKAEYESYTILELTSEFITFIEKFPLKINTIKYFTMLFNIFISRGHLFMAANVLYRLLNIEKKTNLTKEYVLTLINLMYIKDHEEEYHKMLCGLSVVTDSQFKSELDNFLYDQDIEIYLENSDLQNFESILIAKGKSFEMTEDFRNYVAFMKLNNFEYFIEDGIFFFNGNYTKKSNSKKIFEIVNSIKEKSNYVDSRKIEENRIRSLIEREKHIKTRLESKKMVESPVQIEEPIEEKNKEDFFTKRFNFYRIYEMSRPFFDSDSNFAKRQKQIEQSYQSDILRLEDCIFKYNERKDEIEQLIKDAESKHMKQSTVSVRIITDSDQKSESSWRYASRETLLQDIRKEESLRDTERFYKPHTTNMYVPPPVGEYVAPSDRYLSDFNSKPKELSQAYDPSRSFGSMKKLQSHSVRPDDTSECYRPSFMSSTDFGFEKGSSSVNQTAGSSENVYKPPAIGSLKINAPETNKETPIKFSSSLSIADPFNIKKGAEQDVSQSQERGVYKPSFNRFDHKSEYIPKDRTSLNFDRQTSSDKTSEPGYYRPPQHSLQRDARLPHRSDISRPHHKNENKFATTHGKSEMSDIKNEYRFDRYGSYGKSGNSDMNHNSQGRKRPEEYRRNSEYASKTYDARTATSSTGSFYRPQFREQKSQQQFTKADNDGIYRPPTLSKRDLYQPQFNERRDATSGQYSPKGIRNYQSGHQKNKPFVRESNVGKNEQPPVNSSEQEIKTVSPTIWHTEDKKLANLSKVPPQKESEQKTTTTRFSSNPFAMKQKDDKNYK